MADPCVLRHLRTGGTIDSSRGGEVGCCNHRSFGAGAGALAQVWTSVPPTNGFCGLEESVQETYRVDYRSGARSDQYCSGAAYTDQLECCDFHHTSVNMKRWAIVRRPLGRYRHGLLFCRDISHILPPSRSFMVITFVYIWSWRFLLSSWICCRYLCAPWFTQSSLPNSRSPIQTVDIPGSVYQRALVMWAAL